MPFWLISLWKNPVARYAAIMVVILVAGTAWTKYHRYMAATEARAECEADSLRATLEIERQRARVAEEIAEEAERRADLTARELADLEAKTNEILEDLPDDGACVAPDDILERLRGIQ
tara:strand:- start:19980 stop:20333 length:354 start_codon:yes stop_codon:yes gene_type:complete